MIFKRSLQRYGRTPLAETPYARASQAWDERIGSARVQARNWRLVALFSLLLTGGTSSALIWQSLQSRVVPYVVEVDALGEARAVNEATAHYVPTDPQIAWYLARFISNIRSISLDPILVRRGWVEAYGFVTERGARVLGDHARANDPFARIGERTVSVQVTSVVRASDRSFQLKWTETVFERGTETGSSRWTAIVAVVTRPPSSSETLRRNPLGIYVDAIDWSRELDVESSRPAATDGLRPAPAMPAPLGTGTSQKGDRPPEPTTTPPSPTANQETRS